MAGYVMIKDKITGQDLRNLQQPGVRLTVKLDLTHFQEEKPIHLDIELDFGKWKPGAEMAAMLSQFKQKYTSTYGKLRVGEYSPNNTRLGVKHEAPAFGGSVIADATNAHAAKAAMEKAKAGEKMGMFLLKY
jgi:hypothetical protein